MKRFHRSRPIALPRTLRTLLVAAAAALLWAMPGTARGQIFVTNHYAGTIGEYTTSGATVNASLITGLSGPYGLALSGTDLFVANYISGTIGKYTTSGATVNASLVTGLIQPADVVVSGGLLYVSSYGGDKVGVYNAVTGAAVNASLITLDGPTGVVVSGTDLFVASYNSGTIGEYNAVSGATVNATLVSGLGNPEGLVLSGSNLFVANVGSGTIGEYTTAGATVNASLVSGLSGPVGLALSGSDLFVGNIFDNTIGEYTTSGATVNAALVSGLDGPFGIAVVPEPSTWTLLAAAALLLAFRRRRSRGRSRNRLRHEEDETRHARFKGWGIGLVGCILGICASETSAAVISYQDGQPTPIVGGTYTGAEDTMILSNLNDGQHSTRNYGGRADIEVGEQPSGSQHYPRHGLFRFDVTSLAGQYASINSVTLRMRVSTNYSAAGSGSDTLQLFQMAPANSGWVEGTGNNVQQTGSSSWDRRIHPGTTWAGSAGASTAGTDYLTPVIASAGFNDTTPGGTIMDWVFSDISFIPTWVSGTNAGLLMRLPIDTININRALSFDSSEAATLANRPQLIIDYTPIPEPGTLTLAVFGLTAGLLGRRRVRRSKHLWAPPKRSVDGHWSART